MNSLLFTPCVFPCGSDYHVCFITDKPGMAYVTAGEEKFFDAAAGLMRWNSVHHRVIVPQSAMDTAGSYTVHFMAMEDRAPYFPQHGQDEAVSFSFHPIDTGNGLKLYHLADTHGRLEDPVACVKPFKDHTLIFDGDIASHNSAPEDLYLLYRINEQVTGGERPILFARGNHDTRGPMAYLLPELIPVRDGVPYFTFTSGDAWGIALDCGEDKLDDHEEYGGTTAFQPYRERETQWLEEVLEKGEWKDYRYRIAICHIPFTISFPSPFDIEKDKYARWTEILGEMGVQALISGHMHYYDVIKPGDPSDIYGQRFPTVIGSSLKKDGTFTGCALKIDDNGLCIQMTGPGGAVAAEYIIKK